MAKIYSVALLVMHKLYRFFIVFLFSFQATLKFILKHNSGLWPHSPPAFQTYSFLLRIKSLSRGRFMTVSDIYVDMFIFQRQKHQLTCFSALLIVSQILLFLWNRPALANCHFLSAGLLEPVGSVLDKHQQHPLSVKYDLCMWKILICLIIKRH